VSDGRRVAASTLAGLAGRAAVLALGLISVAVTTRYLGTAGYGRLALALALTQLFGVLADAGLTAVVVRDLARSPERAPALVGSAVALRAGLAVVAAAAAVLAALALPYPGDVRLAVVVLGVPLALGVLASIHLAVLQARLRAGRAALADVAGRAASLAAVVLVAALDLGFLAVAATAAVGAAVTFAAMRALAARELPGRPRADRATTRGLLGAAAPVGIALALNELYLRADLLIISLSRPARELGLYALGWRVVELAATLPAVFLFAVFPVLARRGGAGEEERRALGRATDALLLAAVPLASGGALVAPELVRTLGGPGFADAAGPLRLLLGGAALGFLAGLLGHALIARDRQRPALWLNVAVLALNVSLNVVLVPRYGIEAAAWSFLGCEALSLAGSAWLVRRHLGFAPRVTAAGPALVAGAAMAAVVWPLREAPLWLSVPAGAATYAAVLAPLGGLARLRELRG